MTHHTVGCMPSPRHTQIDIHATPYYHCISRCVRRAFLCGTDRLSGQSFDHRKTWLVELLAELTSIFAVELCAYSVLSNHYHLLARPAVRPQLVHALSERIDRAASQCGCLGPFCPCPSGIRSLRERWYFWYRSPAILWLPVAVGHRRSRTLRRTAFSGAHPMSPSTCTWSQRSAGYP